jgi:hypothetical protein
VVTERGELAVKDVNLAFKPLQLTLAGVVFVRNIAGYEQPEAQNARFGP